MLVKLYKCISDVNVINKKLIEELSIRLIYKNVLNLDTPTLRIESDVFLGDYNYCFIEDFNRYYFISNIDIEGMNVYILNLRIDVIESFKSQILDSNCKIKKSSSGNAFIDGGNYKNEVKKEVDIYSSNTVFKSHGTLIGVIIK